MIYRFVFRVVQGDWRRWQADRPLRRSSDCCLCSLTRVPDPCPGWTGSSWSSERERERANSPCFHICSPVFVPRQAALTPLTFHSGFCVRGSENYKQMTLQRGTGIKGEMVPRLCVCIISLFILSVLISGVTSKYIVNSLLLPLVIACVRVCVWVCQNLSDTRD